MVKLEIIQSDCSLHSKHLDIRSLGVGNFLCSNTESHLLFLEVLHFVIPTSNARRLATKLYETGSENKE